jgi:hypothetical protein
MPVRGALRRQGHLPQDGPPAVDGTSSTQKPSQAALQQSALFAHTHVSTA